MSEPEFRIVQGDALALLKEQPDASVDALITDGPYSSGGATRGDRVVGPAAKYISSDSDNRTLVSFAGDNRDQRSFAYWCALWLSECLRVVKPGGPGLLFTDWRQLPATTDSFQAGGWVWRGVVPWVKPTARPQKGRFSAASEFVVWGSAGPMPTEGPCLPGWFNFESPREREHITQKPLGLMRELVKICPPGGIVLDPFAGSGTTGEAAILEGRRFLGFEITHEHAAIATAKCSAAVRGYRPDHAQVGIDFSATE